MVAVAVLAAMLAAWVSAGPSAPAARLAAVLGMRDPRPDRRMWKALVDRRRPMAEAAAWRAACIELCEGMVAELAAGKQAGEALVRAVSAMTVPDAAALLPVAAAARDGGDVPAALARAAPPQGGEGLVRLAACWRVSVTVGGDLIALVERLAVSLRAAESHRQDVAAQLAGPRATARMLAGLPLLGFLMAAGLGMSPVSFLLGSPAGLGCLTIGLALDATGVWWTGRLVAGAQGWSSKGRRPGKRDPSDQRPGMRRPVAQEPGKRGLGKRGRGLGGRAT
jgi:tight adherence protein B